MTPDPLTPSPDSPTPADYDPETFIRELADRWAKIEIPSGKPYVPFMRDRYAACLREYREVVLRECDGDGRIEEIVVQSNKIKELERENAALVKEREELKRDKETFQRRLEKALQTIDELNDSQPDMTLIEEVRGAANAMFEVVDMRRNRNALQDRADFLIKRGWTPIPFTPQGAPEGFVTKITHPSQRWQKHGETNRITEQALKIELREDTDNLRAVLSRLNPRK